MSSEQIERQRHDDRAKWMNEVEKSFLIRRIIELPSQECAIAIAREWDEKLNVYWARFGHGCHVFLFYRNEISGILWLSFDKMLHVFRVIKRFKWSTYARAIHKHFEANHFEIIVRDNKHFESTVRAIAAQSRYSYCDKRYTRQLVHLRNHFEQCALIILRTKCVRTVCMCRFIRFRFVSHMKWKQFGPQNKATNPLTCYS